MLLGFVQGNFTTSPFKVIGHPADAVILIDRGRSHNTTKTAPAACPTLVGTHLKPHREKSTPWQTDPTTFSSTPGCSPNPNAPSRLGLRHLHGEQLRTVPKA
jgi:hypothetical protein